MKGNQNLPNKQITSDNMASKPLIFPCHSRSNSGENLDIFRLRTPNKSSFSNSKPYYGNNNFKLPSRPGSPDPRQQNYQKKPYYNKNIIYSKKSRPQSPNHNRDGNSSRQPFLRNGFRNVRNYINSPLDQVQTNDTTSNTEQMKTQKISEEQLLEQQFNDLLFELQQNTPDEDFSSQGECNIITQEKNFPHRVKIIFGYYQLQFSDNRHPIIREWSPQTRILKLTA